VHFPQVVLCTLFYVASNLSANAQTATAPVPPSPKGTLQLAQTTNGLNLTPTIPWHIKLTYDQFDEDGDNIHSGTVEEFYASPKKYKRIFISDTLKQTDIATSNGLFRSGDQQWEGSIELQVQQETITPLYRANLAEKNTRLDSLDWPIGKNTLPCVVIRRTDMTISDNGLPKYCFDSGTTKLRYTRGTGWDETVYNNMFLFQGRAVARDITVTNGGKPKLKIHVEILEELSQPDDTLFTPPSDSTKIAGRIKIQGAILNSYIIDRTPLEPNGEKGTLTVRFVVGKDGKVIEAEVLDGPKGLQKGVLHTIRGYKFRPFLVLDEPVEVESKMTFNFQ
jgi:hypothetical protein